MDIIDNHKIFKVDNKIHHTKTNSFSTLLDWGNKEFQMSDLRLRERGQKNFKIIDLKEIYVRRLKL